MAAAAAAARTEMDRAALIAFTERRFGKRAGKQAMAIIMNNKASPTPTVQLGRSTRTSAAFDKLNAKMEQHKASMADSGGRSPSPSAWETGSHARSMGMDGTVSPQHVMVAAATARDDLASSSDEDDSSSSDGEEMRTTARRRPPQPTTGRGKRSKRRGRKNRRRSGPRSRGTRSVASNATGTLPVASVHSTPAGSVISRVDDDAKSVGSTGTSSMQLRKLLRATRYKQDPTASAPASSGSESEQTATQAKAPGKKAPSPKPNTIPVPAAIKGGGGAGDAGKRAARSSPVSVAASDAKSVKSDAKKVAKAVPRRLNILAQKQSHDDADGAPPVVLRGGTGLTPRSPFMRAAARAAAKEAGESPPSASDDGGSGSDNSDAASDATSGSDADEAEAEQPAGVPDVAPAAEAANSDDNDDSDVDDSEIDEGVEEAKADAPEAMGIPSFPPASAAVSAKERAARRALQKSAESHGSADGDDTDASDDDSDGDGDSDGATPTSDIRPNDSVSQASGGGVDAEDLELEEEVEYEEIEVEEEVEEETEDEAEEENPVAAAGAGAGAAAEAAAAAAATDGRAAKAAADANPADDDIDAGEGEEGEEEDDEDVPDNRRSKLVGEWVPSRKFYEVDMLTAPLGIKFRADKSTPVVEIVRDGSAAADCGVIAPGDTLVAVNNESITGMRMKDAAAIIGRAASAARAEGDAYRTATLRFNKTGVRSRSSAATGIVKAGVIVNPKIERSQSLRDAAEAAQEAEEAKARADASKGGCFSCFGKKKEAAQQ